MARTAGTASVVTMTAVGGASYGVTLSSNLRGASLGNLQPEIDVTTLSDSDRTYVQGFKESTFSFDGIFEATIDGQLFALRGAGSASPFRYYPQGTASGNVLYSFDFRLLDYQVPTNLEEAVTFTASGRASSVTRSTV